MGLETNVDYINDLNPLNPTQTDPQSQGDDHIRLIKQAIVDTFPQINGRVNVTEEEINRLQNLNRNVASVLDAIEDEIASNESTRNGQISSINSNINDINSELDNLSDDLQSHRHDGRYWKLSDKAKFLDAKAGTRDDLVMTPEMTRSAIIQLGLPPHGVDYKWVNTSAERRAYEVYRNDYGAMIYTCPNLSDQSYLQVKNASDQWMTVTFADTDDDFGHGVAIVPIPPGCEYRAIGSVRTDTPGGTPRWMELRP